MVVNFRVNHTPLVLTGETREMQENGTPAKCSLYISQKRSIFIKKDTEERYGFQMV